MQSQSSLQGQKQLLQVLLLLPLMARQELLLRQLQQRMEKLVKGRMLLPAT
jgi:hypothetical protein